MRHTQQSSICDRKAALINIRTASHPIIATTMDTKPAGWNEVMLAGLGRMAHRPTTALQLAAVLHAAFLHTGVTIWHRWPLLMALWTRRISPAEASELNLMVSEKVAAAAQGLLDTQTEILRLTSAALLGWRAFDVVPHASIAIAKASLAPALATVKNNSKRLGRTKRRP